MSVEWRGAVDFAEVAETLHVPTDRIMAARDVESRSVLVLFSPHEYDPLDPDPLVCSVTLRRGVDDVLFVASAIVEHPGLWRQLVEQIERGMPPP